MSNEDIFEEIENTTQIKEDKEVLNNEEVKAVDEINLDDLSSKAVSENKKYERESLDGEVVKIKSVKLFNPNREEDDVITSLTNKDTKYYKTKFIITYDKKNKDDVYHREYLSGAIQYIQKDNSLSAPVFWFKGTRSQVGKLWELVAKHKGINPEDLSPREFIGFLNSGVKVKIKESEVEFANTIYKKNLPAEFVE